MPRLLAVCLGAAGLAAGPVAAPGAARADAMQPPAQPPAQHNAGPAPHRAIYALAIDRVGATAGLAAAGGAIYHELRATCDAWRVHQRFRLRVVRSDRAAEETEIGSVLVEARNGRRLSFSTVTSADGRVTDRLSGVATLGRSGPGTVTLEEPRSARVPLPAGTLFPVRHFLTIARLAGEGRRSIWSTIFDGSEEDGRHSSVNVLLLRRMASPGAAETRRLLRRPGWLMRVTYFAPEAGADRPVYSYRAHMHDNGVARDMLLDFGAFTLAGTLKAIEPLAQPEC